MEEKDVLYSPEFKRALKPLAKKYFTLKASLKALQSDLCKNPHLGDSYGDGIFKIRLADESKGTGKSGGFRLLYYHLSLDENSQVTQILFLTIFDKGEQATIKAPAAKKLKTNILKSMGLYKK